MATKYGSETSDYFKGYITYSSSSTNTSVTVSISEAGAYCTASTTATSGQWYVNLAATSQTTKRVPSSGRTTASVDPGKWLNITGSQTFTYTRGKTASTATVSATTYFTKNGGSSYTSSTASSAEISIPAKPSYTVSYDANGGSGAPSSQTKWYDETLTLSSTEPKRTGYTFSGWNTKANGTGTNYSKGGSYTSNSAVTLYAKWAVNTYTVTYYGNGGTWSGGTATQTQTKTYGQPLTLSVSAPTLSGYACLGWSTTSNGSVEYPLNGTYTGNSALSLYAVWASTYAEPAISDISVYRCNENGEETISGKYANLSFNWTAGIEGSGTINQTQVRVTQQVNTQTIVYYSETTTSPYSAGGSVNLSPLELNDEPVIFSIDESFTLSITIQDRSKLPTIVRKKVDITIPKGGMILHINETGSAISFMGLASNEDKGVYAPEMTSSEVDTFLDSLNQNFRGTVDWVVAQGTSGEWTYRKWDSGISECWMSHTYTNVTATTTWGTLYYGTLTSTLTYPSGLFNTAPQLEITIQSQGGRFWPSYEPPSTSVTTNVGTIYNLAPQAYSGNSTAILNLHAYGTWK